MKYRRAWEGGEWQSFAHQLVQLRHGHENIQCVPDTVGGDAGLEFFFVGGTLYQCYAPEEAVDVAKAAVAQKAKATKDLKKLSKHKDKLAKILAGLNMNRWILLCPFLDNKDVVTHVRNKAIALRDEKLPFLSDSFEGLIHSQEDFAAEIEHLRQQSVMPLSVAAFGQVDIADHQDSEIGRRVLEKLNRGFAATETPWKILERRDAYLRAHVRRENTLDELKQNHPALWDRSIQCLSTEEERLVAVGATSAIPGQQLSESVERIAKALRTDLPVLPTSFATAVALGTVGEWLIRCPLDFPEPSE